ncbi:hypothetical protein VTK73DRAFT_8805 [Phialemonium thermophilum]|uniref:Methyltransferase domain-containing protein n=1 Tax=Phialemonium thermophilum TaxID=223376 RepID=A0ABR3W688_9PEZI
MSEPTTKPATEPASTATAPQPAAAQNESGILPPQHWAQLAEEGHDDSSDFEDAGSSTASLSSSLLNYRTIQGRRYHSDQGNAQYWAANDDAQNEALDIIHHVITLLLDGKLHLAPLKDDIQKVLDVGTGTGTWLPRARRLALSYAQHGSSPGIWAIDFADEHPSVSVLGTDISSIQPGWIPPNLQFQIDDCTQEWTFPENTFDYVHIRWLFGSIVDWTALFKQAYRSLKPGGYIESHEPSVSFLSDDGTVNDKTAMGQFGKFFVEGGKKMGRSTTVLEDGIQRKGIEEAGFVDIHEVNLKTPVGGWPKDPKQREIGKFQQLAVLNDLEGTMLYMSHIIGWSRDELTVYMAQLRRELRSKDIHGYYWQKVVWARKPESA